jgi:hypothetical protein
VAEDGARLLAVYFPSPWEMVDEHWRGFHAWVTRCRPAHAPDRWAGERTFDVVFGAAGVERVSLRTAFAAALAGGADLYLPDGHLSAAGHGVVAAALAEVVRPER